MNTVLTRAFSLLLAALGVASISSCGDSVEEREERAAQFTTSTKPAPNPQFEPITSMLRTDRVTPDSLRGSPSFPLSSDYAGEDIRQVTGVSGRSLLLCFACDWCPHSKRMRDSLDKLALKEKGSLQVIYVNPDNYPILAEQFKLDRVPTTVLYTEGVKLRVVYGAYSTRSMENYLRNVLSQSEERKRP